MRKHRYITANSDKKTSSIDENIMPMINIVFLLLVFFMVSGTIKESDPFQLIPAISMSKKELTLKDQIIYINKNGSISYNDRLISYDQLKAEISQSGLNGNWYLKVDANFNGKELVSVMQGLARLGVKEIELITLKREG